MKRLLFVMRFPPGLFYEQLVSRRDRKEKKIELRLRLQNIIAFVGKRVDDSDDRRSALGIFAAIRCVQPVLRSVLPRQIPYWVFLTIKVRR